VIQDTALILLNMKSAEPKPFIATEESGRGGGVRAEWQERHKTPARLQRKAATVRGSRWQLWQTKKG